MERILAIDPGLSTGYALFEVDKRKATLLQYNHLQLELASRVTADDGSSSVHRGDNLVLLANQLRELIRKHSITHIVYEDYVFNRFQMGGCTTNIAYRAIIELVAREQDIPYSVAKISTWKKYIVGHINPTKAQTTLWGKEAKKVMVQEALWNNYQIRFPNHSISTNTSKPIKFRYDLVDVVAQGIYFVCSERSVSEIVSNVVVPDDAPVGDKWFVYRYPDSSAKKR